MRLPSPIQTMTETTTGVRIRPLDELDISDIVAIDEAISGHYRPEVWERRISYYLRRAPESSVVAEVDGKVAGFMLGEIRSGEFGLEEPTGWIEVLGVDPRQQGKALGRRSVGWSVGRSVMRHGSRRIRDLRLSLSPR